MGLLDDLIGAVGGAETTVETVKPVNINGGENNDKICAESGEEEEAIEENLAHMCQFLDNLHRRGTQNLPVKSLDKLNNLRDQLHELVPVVLRREGEDTKFKKPKGEPVIQPDNLKFMEKGAIPKRLKGVEKAAAFWPKDKPLLKKDISLRLDGKSTSVKPKLTKIVSDNKGDSDSEELFTDTSVPSDASDMSSCVESSNSCSEFSNLLNSYSSDSSLKSKANQKMGKKKPTPTKKKSPAGGMHQLIKAMSRLDARKIPHMEKFEEGSGQELMSYLKKFEHFCKNNYRGDKVLWIGELEQHLSGKIQSAFKAMRDVDDTYEDAKEKLVEWYDNMKEMRKNKNKMKFRNVKYVKGETLYLYSLRVEKLFKIAYPKHAMNTSQSLQERFIATIPKTAKGMMTAQVMSYKMKDRRISWKEIKKLARYYDLEKQKEEEEKEDDHESDQDIVINVGKPKKGKDVATQNDENYHINRYKGKIYYAEEFNKPNSNSIPQQYKANKPYTTFLPQSTAFLNSNNHQYRRDNNNSYQGQDRYNMKRTSSNNNYTGNFHYDQQGKQYQTGPLFTRPNEKLRSSSTTCTFCNRIGHSVANCRTKWNCCYSCGTQGHYFADCPQNPQKFRARSHSSQPLGRDRVPLGNRMNGYNSMGHDNSHNNRPNKSQSQNSQSSHNIKQMSHRRHNSEGHENSQRFREQLNLNALV